MSAETGGEGRDVCRNAWSEGGSEGGREGGKWREMGEWHGQAQRENRLEG